MLTADRRYGAARPGLYCSAFHRSASSTLTNIDTMLARVDLDMPIHHPFEQSPRMPGLSGVRLRLGLLRYSATSFSRMFASLTNQWSRRARSSAPIADKVRRVGRQATARDRLARFAATLDRTSAEGKITVCSS